MKKKYISGRLNLYTFLQFTVCGIAMFYAMFKPIPLQEFEVLTFLFLAINWSGHK